MKSPTGRRSVSPLNILCGQTAVFTTDNPESPRRKGRGNLNVIATGTLSVIFIYLFARDFMEWMRLQNVGQQFLAKAKTENSEGLVVSKVLGVSIKGEMEDPIVVWVHEELCLAFEHTFNLSGLLPWLTPNMITTLHILISLGSGYMVSSPLLHKRQLAVGLYWVRSILDKYDGVLFRVRKARLQAQGVTSPPDLRSFGYYFDGYADSIALLVFLVGLNQSWINRSSKGDNTRPVSSLTGDLPVAACETTPARSTFAAWFIFGMQCLLCSLFWNTFVLSYSDLLDERRSWGGLQRQVTVMLWSSTYFLMWVWKYLTLTFFQMNLLTLAVLCDAESMYIRTLRVLGWVVLLSFGAVTQWHISIATVYVGNS